MNPPKNGERHPGMVERWNDRARLTVILCATVAACPRFASAQPAGVIDAHDPSTVIDAAGTYYYYATGQGIISRSSTDATTWVAGPSVFATEPAWTTTAVPGFTGFFWAPDIIFRNNQFYLYYAVSTFGSKVSAIGLATSPTLNPSAPNYAWTDQGPVIQSGNANNFNAIDPSILQDTTTGLMWMSYGSYNTGIYIGQLDPTTGKRLATTAVNVAYNSSIEASALIQHGSYYYLMVNWGMCCSGVDSTYQIRMGRSTSPTGPFLDENGVNMLNGGGTIFYDDDGSRIGPGQFGFLTNGTQDQFSYHYYDGNNNGAPTFGLSNLYWTAAGWPSVAAVNPNWTGATSANWSAAGNWSDTAPGAAGSIANFTANTANRYIVTVDGAKTVSRINFTSSTSYTIGVNGGNTITFSKMALDATATINVSAGSHTIAAPISATDDLGINVAPTASTLTLSGALAGAGLYKYGFGTLTLGGADTFTGPVYTHAGTLQFTGAATVGANLTAGGVAGDIGTIIISGNSSVSVTDDFNVGDTGDSVTPATGTLFLSGNASVTVAATGAFVVGSGFFSNTAAVGTVQQSGGTLTANGNFDGAFIIGGRGSSLATGTYNLTAGAVNANTNVRVGGYGTGTFNQTGGTFSSNFYVSIGRFAGASGTWNISGGLLNVTNAADWLLVGEGGSGTLNISGSGLVTTANVIRVGHSGGAGIINLNGGTLTTLGIQRGTGTATFNFNGGTLTPTAAGTTFLQGLTTANVQSGGAILNTNGKSITIAQPLLHAASLGATPDGGLTKNGAGNLTLSATNTYTGGTTVNTGLLIFSAAADRPTGDKLTLNNLTSAARVVVKADAPNIASYRSQLLTGYNAGHWSAAAGITSTAATTLANTAIGYLTGAQYLDLHATTDFATGYTVATTDVLLRYTYMGDADLSGAITIADYSQIDAAFLLHTANPTWFNGDFNYDGTVDYQDYALLDAAYAAQSGPLASAEITNHAAEFGAPYLAALQAAATPVPEPASLLLLVLGSVVLARRERRQ